MSFSKYLRILVVASIAGLFVTQATFAATPLPRQVMNARTREVDQFLIRWKDQGKHTILSHAITALTDDGSNRERTDAVIKSVTTFQTALDQYEAGDSSALARLGGLKGFKNTVAGWLSDKDESVRSYAALFLGVSGDRTYAGRIAPLLKERKTVGGEPVPTDRGNAATAFGLMGAKQYKQTLINLMSSPNEFDRAGAVYGLGYLKAKDQELAIGRLLYDKNDAVRDAAEKALAIMDAD
jgi:HEAT repeat protein